MTCLLKASLLVREWPHHARLLRATQRPDLAQAAYLDALIRRNAETAFGRDHGFSRIRGSADYARQVPIRDYEGFRPYVSRILAGEPRVLTAETPFMFTTTSGTTGEPKLVAVTPSWRRQMAGMMRLWTFYALRDHPGLFGRQVLTIVSPAVEGTTPTGIPFGAMSGVAYQRLPWLVRRQHVLPYPVFLIGDYEARYFVIMRLALAHSVSAIGTPNPSTLIRLAETASSRAEEILRAIHDGTLGIPMPEIRAERGRAATDSIGAIGTRLRPDPERARFLARVVEAHGALSLRHCWPELRLVACWLGGNAGIQARRLGEHYGADVPLRDLGLIASEGRMTIPLEDGSPAGVLAVHASFFEFIPEESIEDPSPPTRLAHELEEGHRYYLILTGGNGLYRYDLNDIVEVRGFLHRTPKVAFVRKGRDMTSITGEKLHLNQILAAIREAERATRREIWQFRIIPDVERGRYDLLVEFHERGDAGAPPAGFLEAFDRALAALNVEYASKRASMRLGPPRLCVMRPGWSERLCRAEFRQGRRDYQHKWPAIRPEWDEASRGEVMERVEWPAEARRPEGHSPAPLP